MSVIERMCYVLLLISRNFFKGKINLFYKLKYTLTCGHLCLWQVQIWQIHFESNWSVLRFRLDVIEWVCLSIYERLKENTNVTFYFLFAKFYSIVPEILIIYTVSISSANINLFIKKKLSKWMSIYFFSRIIKIFFLLEKDTLWSYLLNELFNLMNFFYHLCSF